MHYVANPKSYKIKFHNCPLFEKSLQRIKRDTCINVLSFPTSNTHFTISSFDPNKRNDKAIEEIRFYAFDLTLMCVGHAGT